MIKKFKTGMELFPNALESLKSLSVPCNYLEGEHVRMWLRAPTVDTSQLCGIDIETYPDPQFEGTFQAGLMAVKSLIRTIQIYDGKEVVILDLMDSQGGNILTDRGLLSAVCTLLKSGTWTAHNAQFEMDYFVKLMELDGSPQPIMCYCTRNAYRLINQAETHNWKRYDASLQGVARRVLGVNVDKDVQHDRWKIPGPLDAEQLNYCARDAILPRILLEILHGNLADLSMVDFFKLNTEMHNVISHMHLYGNPIDEEKHDVLIADWKEKLEAAELECFALLNADKGFADAEAAWEVIQPKIAKKYQKPVAEFMMRLSPIQWADPHEIRYLSQLFFGKAAQASEDKDEGLRKAFKRAAVNLEEHLINPGSDAQLSRWMKTHMPKEVLAEWPLTDGSLEYVNDCQEKGVEVDPTKLQLSMSGETFIDVGDIEEIRPIQVYKKYSKLYSTYGVGLKEFYVNCPWAEKPTIHSQYSLCYTETGRQSTYSPTTQNAPNSKEFRAIYTTRGPGYKFVSADFSQIELRIEAEITQDPVMLEVYRRGGDIHSETTTAISGLSAETADPDHWTFVRKCAKIVNFSTVYGGGAGAVRKGTRKAGLNLTLADCQEFIDRYRERFNVAREWQVQQAEHCKPLRKVTIPGGKIASLYPDWEYTQSLNYPVQGSAGVVEFLAACALYEFYCANPQLDFRILKLVHDSIDCECRADQVEELKAAMIKIMQEAMLKVFPDAPVFNIAEIHDGDFWEDW